MRLSRDFDLCLLYRGKNRNGDECGMVDGMSIFVWVS